MPRRGRSTNDRATSTENENESDVESVVSNNEADDAQEADTDTMNDTIIEFGNKRREATRTETKASNGDYKSEFYSEFENFADYISGRIDDMGTGMYRAMDKLTDTVDDLKFSLHTSIDKMSDNISKMNTNISDLSTNVRQLTVDVSQLTHVMLTHFQRLDNQTHLGHVNDRRTSESFVNSNENNQSTRNTSAHQSHRNDMFATQSTHGAASTGTLPSISSHSNTNNKVASVRIPAFTGDERWDIWKKMFDRTAVTNGWSEIEKLAQLLPRIQGSAGDFVHGQLSNDVAYDYDRLVRELESRYRVIETPKMFGAQFSNRKQKQNETVFEYAADLKRLYDKAHSNRDTQTRKEDLLRRFLDGLHDDEARFAVEFNKDPNTIDEAVNQVINFQEAKRCAENLEKSKNGKNRNKKARVAWADLDESSDDNDDENQSKPKKPRVRRHQNTDSGKGEQRGITPNSAPQQSNDHDLLLEVTAKLTQIEKSLNSNNRAEIIPPANLPRIQRRGNIPQRDITCFKCHEKGHFARECKNTVNTFPAVHDMRSQSGSNLNTQWGIGRQVFGQSQGAGNSMQMQRSTSSAQGQITPNFGVNDQNRSTFGTNMTNGNLNQPDLNFNRPNLTAGMRS